jgi:hypothetical protein
MLVEFSDDQAEELQTTLDVVISDMSSEIADTDNPFYRRGLKDRRDRLRAIVALVVPLAPAGGKGPSAGTAAGGT